ncbi:MAG: Rpn family recombination-promoting nuclease/putative transposase [Muribaculaceae bacterium]|nr:Rpn family recombination-promoting nuclease/putative transposase [Muribaculaceae bacterium]
MSEDTPKISTTFINLQSDFGFKRSFGTSKYQINVVKLIEAALGDEINVERIVPYEENKEYDSVRFHDKEVLPSEQDGKRILYDVYFTMKVASQASLFKPAHLHKDLFGKEVEHHFILEMQNVYTPPFEDRMTYYTSKMIARQGKAGWNYDLDPVVLMAVTDFDFPHLCQQLVHEFELREKTSGESLTKKLRMLFFSLRQLPERWDDCSTELERRLYLIKHMDKMDKNSKPYLQGGYEEMFDSAESSNVVGEEAVAYSRSLAALREVQAGLDYRFEEGRAEGRAEGREMIARKLKKEGVDLEFIAMVTDLPIDKVREL